MSPEASPPTTDLPLLVGRYRLLDKLGEGGMGAVFRAQDTKLDRSVAVKLLPAGTAHDQGAVARFGREAKALAHLAHPGIIQAHDSGQDNGRHFLVMEMVEGRSLAKLLSDQGGLAPTRAADYVHQAALALDHAHRHGLVHRDVKPSNLLVTGEGRVKLLDLGLARFLQDQVGDGTLTREGTGLGTPDYAAPEQFRDAHKADTRSDIYALGCTLYHLIAGRVPFPGSSLSEKLLAHERHEPPLLEELCPQMPVGLALVARRMMAKRPADRFASMAEVAAALTPFVAGSSTSCREIRNTATWTGAQLVTMAELPGRRRRVRQAAVAVAGLVVAVTVLGLGFALGWFGPDEGELAQGAGAALEPGKAAPMPGDGGKSPGPGALAKVQGPHDPNVLTVAQKPGAAQFQTITAALDAVKPGQMIRVLDGEVYRERLSITRASIHNGITLEAPGGAVLETTTSGSVLIDIAGVQGVTLRSLRLRASSAERCTLVVASGNYAGLRLEGLEMSFEGNGSNNSGAELLAAASASADQDPVIVQGCRFRGLSIGVRVGTENSDDSIARLAVRDGLFTDCAIGVVVKGRARAIQVVGNRFWGARFAALQLQYIAPDSEQILLANNTCFEGNAALRLWDRAVNGKDVQVRNNLVLGAKLPDMIYLETDDPDTARGHGDGRAVAAAYDFGHNWREGRAPTGRAARPWVRPDPKKGDDYKGEIDGVKRKPGSPDFLRPDVDSPLATAGAGNVDPRLPRYVGALPPEGTEPWDWDRAWRMPKGARLLTVSLTEGDQAGYETIGQALKEARPWDTIRVLDGGTYEEQVALKDRKMLEGITLEAVKGATLQLPTRALYLLTIADVPRVRLAGFKLTNRAGAVAEADAARALVVVSGKVPGVTLTHLELVPRSPLLGIVAQNVAATPAEPLRIDGCVVRPACPESNDGIIIAGNIEREPTTSVCIRGNRISRCFRGINVRGTLHDVHVTGNLMTKCKACGLQLEDLASASRGLLIANNTAFDCLTPFRIWFKLPQDEPKAGQVEVANNLIFASAASDLGYILSPGLGKDPEPGDGKALLKLWRFHHNCRDYSGPNSAFHLPVGAAETRFQLGDVLGADPADLDRVRPGKDSPLAVQGAGTVDGSLPAYIGALPREGEPPWDWDRTWLARVPTRTGATK
jgi:nitrous oxidase accessory protein NosD